MLQKGSGRFKSHPFAPIAPQTDFRCEEVVRLRQAFSLPQPHHFLTSATGARKNNKMRLNRPEIISRACELLLAPFLSKEEDKSLLRTGGKMSSGRRNLRGTEVMDWQLTPASWGPGVG